VNELTQTIATYAQIAGAYARARQDRAPLKPHFERFAALLEPGGRVLDAGSGPGFDTAVLQSAGFRALGLDLSWQMLRAGRDELGLCAPLVQGDLRALPFGAGSFDGVWACAALLHLPRTAVAPALGELRRVLAGGGVLYLSVQQGEGEGWQPRAYGQARPRFFTYWQPAALDAALAAAGLRPNYASAEAAGPTVWLNRLARAAG
jgi:SAM-dependent methyltransferase